MPFWPDLSGHVGTLAVPHCPAIRCFFVCSISGRSCHGQTHLLHLPTSFTPRCTNAILHPVQQWYGLEAHLCGNLVSCPYHFFMHHEAFAVALASMFCYVTEYVSDLGRASLGAYPISVEARFQQFPLFSELQSLNPFGV